jgi:N-acetyl-anhydromuramyl-L-alanine amidase AmpD
MVIALALLAGVQPAYAEASGRGNDHGDASRPESDQPETAMADYAGARWEAADKHNYTNAQRPGSDKITMVVIHVMQGSYEGTQAWFQNPKSQVTAHYAIRSSDGQITQMVHESDIAWHAGNWDVNTHSIGIEHEGYIADPKRWFTKAMYESSARLVHDICSRYDIPMDRKHIIGHYEVPGATHTDPGSGWDWDRYMDLVRDPVADPR